MVLRGLIIATHEFLVVDKNLTRKLILDNIQVGEINQKILVSKTTIRFQNSKSIFFYLYTKYTNVLNVLNSLNLSLILFYSPLFLFCL